MSWLNKRTVIYHILIDRFARPQSDARTAQEIPDDKPVFCGGNIRGIIEHFDHIRGLGVNALWISPFYKGVAFHGYHTTDLMSMDERFGTEADLKELIDLAHNAGMKIVADFVPNHVSKWHPYFRDAQKNENSIYRDWFYFTHWPDKYLCFLDVLDLPKLNLDHAPTRKHVINAARKWLSLGLDGYRLDHIPGPSNEFWKDFFGTLRKEFPEAEFFGEAWLYGVKFSQLNTLRVSNKYLAWLLGTPYLMKQYEGLFPSLLDFDFNNHIRAFVGNKTSKEKLLAVLQKHFTKRSGTQMLTFLDNHDMDRILFVAGNNIEKVKEAATIQFGFSSPAVIYYGTEFAMTHERALASYKSYGDMVARKMTPWDEGDGKLFDFYRTLIHSKAD